MRAVGINITVGNTQSANNNNRIMQVVCHKANQTNTMEMHETTCASTHSKGVMYRPAHVAHVLATEPTLGVIIPPT